ncbi:MAG: DOPA 4,5-dioxygenase family protein [Deltaproteobacteria bacterium]|nr:DOPA 4,5-dioxygenase family protein [Deltaproteobacteria bacterium]
MENRQPKIHAFHAHIYYDPETRKAAARVREGLARFAVQLGGWHDEPVGPHPKSMYQAVFPPEEFGRVVPWLMLNRENLDILVHPETGDNLADHSAHALWLGTKIELRLRVFGQTTKSAG